MKEHKVSKYSSNYHPNIAYNNKVQGNIQRLDWIITRTPNNPKKDISKRNQAFNELELVPRTPKTKMTNNDQRNIKIIKQANRRQHICMKNFLKDISKSPEIVGGYTHDEHTFHLNKKYIDSQHNGHIYHPHTHLNIFVNNKAKNVELNPNNYKASIYYKLQKMWYKEVHKFNWKNGNYIDKDADLFYGSPAYTNVTGNEHQVHNLQFDNKVYTKKNAAIAQPLDKNVNMSYVNTDAGARDKAYNHGREFSKYSATEAKYDRDLKHGVRDRNMHLYKKGNRFVEIGHVDKDYYAYNKATQGRRKKGIGRVHLFGIAKNMWDITHSSPEMKRSFQQIPILSYHYFNKHNYGTFIQRGHNFIPAPSYIAKGVHISKKIFDQQDAKQKALSFIANIGLKKSNPMEHVSNFDKDKSTYKDSPRKHQHNTEQRDKGQQKKINLIKRRKNERGFK